MRHQKLDVGTLLVGLGAGGLLVSLFLRWYSPSLTAWDAFEFLDWALAACAVLGMAGAALAFAGTPRSWLPAIALGALFVAASQLIDPPPAAHGAGREVGAWLALACTAAMAAGVALTSASIAITVDVRARERRRRVAAVDRRDAAEADGTQPAARRAGLFTDTTAAAEADPERTEAMSALEGQDAEAGET